MEGKLLGYLCNLYSLATGDLTTLVRRNLDGRSGEMTARLTALIGDAVAWAG